MSGRNKVTSACKSQHLCRCRKAGPEVATCGHGEHKVWRWHIDAQACNVRRATSEDVKGLLGDRWFAVVGDSVGRNLFAAFVRLLADECTIIIFYAALKSRCSLLACRKIVVFNSHEFLPKRPEVLQANILWSKGIKTLNI